MKKKKIAIFLAARSGAKRRKKKHGVRRNPTLRVIDLCVLRLKKSRLVNKIFLCTTKKKEDNKFKNICNKNKIKLFKGSTNNVAKRIIDCAKENSIDIIVRITADCPIIDPNIIDECVKLHLNNNNDYTSNTLDLSFPDGLDVEVFNLDILIHSQPLSKTSYNQEHVTSFIRRSKKFKKYSYKNSINYSNRRWTLDHLNDYFFLQKVLKYFSKKSEFSWKDLIKAEKVNNKLINLKKR